MPEFITHAFVAMKAGKSLDYIAGTIYADIGILVDLYRKKVTMDHKSMLAFAKFLEKKKYNKDFIKGIYAHVKLDNYAHKFYIVPLAIKLEKRTKANVHLIHSLSEVIVARRIVVHFPYSVDVARQAIKKADNPILRKYLFEFFSDTPIRQIYDICYKEVMTNEFTIWHYLRTAWRVRKFILTGATGAGIWIFTKVKKAIYSLRKELVDYDKDLKDWIKYQREKIK